jgi:hypothetical protein
MLLRRVVVPAAGVLLASVVAAGCSRGSVGSVPLPALRALDEAHAAEFVQAFDEAKDRPRYVVALSPT